MKRTFAAIAACMLLTVSAWAQMGAKPGAEVKKLDVFSGNWTTEGTIAQGPWGAGGKFTSNETVKWMSGDFFLVTDGDYKMPAELGGDGKGYSVMGYDTDKNTYTMDSFNSGGQHEVAKGTLTGGDTWTWNSTVTYGGQEIQQKTVIKIVSPTIYTMKLDISLDGTNWMNFMEGKATRK